MSKTTSKVKTVVTTAPDGSTTSQTTVFGGQEGQEATVEVKEDGEIVGGGGLRANVRTHLHKSAWEKIVLKMLPSVWMLFVHSELRCAVDDAAGQSRAACGHDSFGRARVSRE